MKIICIVSPLELLGNSGIDPTLIDYPTFLETLDHRLNEVYPNATLENRLGDHTHIEIHADPGHLESHLGIMLPTLEEVKWIVEDTWKDWFSFQKIAGYFTVDDPVWVNVPDNAFLGTRPGIFRGYMDNRTLAMIYFPQTGWQGAYPLSQVTHREVLP